MSVSTGKRARSTGRGGRRVVLAGRGMVEGKPWELWVPEDMPEDERAAYVERQRALLDQAARASTLARSTGPTKRRPRLGAAIVAGALDLAGL